MKPPPALPRARPGVRATPEREREILDVATAVLAERGFDRFSLEEVAKRAGCSRTTLYRRWGGRSRLMVEILGQGPERMPAFDTGSLRSDLIAFFTFASDDLEVRGRLLVGLAAAMQRNPELAEAWNERGLAGGRAAMRVIVRRAVERGEAPVMPDLGLLAAITSGALIWRYGLSEAPPEPRLFGERLVDAVLIPLLVAGSLAGETV